MRRSPFRTIGELAALSPAAFFEAWCEAAYRHRSKGSGGVKAQLERRVIGHLFEGDSLAHVVYRANWWYAVKTMPLKWSGKGWLMLLNDDIGWMGDLNWQLETR